MVAVAQLVRAPGCGPGGRGFESHQPPVFVRGRLSAASPQRYIPKPDGDCGEKSATADATQGDFGNSALPITRKRTHNGDGSGSVAQRQSVPREGRKFKSCHARPVIFLS